MLDVAAFLNEICFSWRCIDEIKENVAKKFDCTVQEVSSDVDTIIHELHDQRLVSIKDLCSSREANIDGEDCFVGVVDDEFTPLGNFYLRRNIPAELHIDLTDACTERCIHCYVPRGQNHFLPYNEAAKAIQEFREMQGLTVHITGGECMLHPDFERVCNLCKSLSLNVIIFSNMTCCDFNRISFLKELDPQFVNVSLYSMDQNVHDSITQVPGSWQKTMDAILACEDAGVSCRIATPILHWNKNDCSGLKRFASEHHMHFVPTIDIIARSDHSCENLSSACSVAEIRQLLSTNRSLFDQNWSGEMPMCDGKVCEIGSGRLYLNAEGRYYPCDSMHDYDLGNVKDNTVEEIWHGEKLNNLRKLKNRDFEICAICSSRPWCKVCPAANYNANRDLFKPPSGYCELARVKKEIFRKD